MKYKPTYISLHKSGELEQRIKYFEKIYKTCTLCPHNCQINRFETKKGKCKSGEKAFVASFNAHFGEERPLVGTKGSGTIFFSSCNLKCVYCQNYDISQLKEGHNISSEQLSKIMLALQYNGCHNINFVTPTHMIVQILRALALAIDKGLNIPLVYNSGGYDSLKTIQKLDGIFDIYMPDIKYTNSTTGRELSKVDDYAEKCMEAVKEMHRQVGDLKINRNGLAYRGLLVRHLVLPTFIDESKKVMDFLRSLSANTYVNVMDQYRPAYKAKHHSTINRKLSLDEYNEVLSYAKGLGLRID